jgi:hypothetical protein
MVALVGRRQPCRPTEVLARSGAARCRCGRRYFIPCINSVSVCGQRVDVGLHLRSLGNLSPKVSLLDSCFLFVGRLTARCRGEFMEAAS